MILKQKFVKNTHCKNQKDQMIDKQQMSVHYEPGQHLL